MSHKLQQNQIDDFQGEMIILAEVNEQLQQKCSNISPLMKTEEVSFLAVEIIREAVLHDCNYIAIMGEPTLVVTVSVLSSAFNIFAITSTTERVSTEEIQENGSVIKRSVFKHVMWRNLI